MSKKIVANWGGYEQFIKAFNTTAAPIQGSGWAWLA